MIHEQNALIESTMLGVEGHGIFTFMLKLKYDCAGQGPGGYALDTPIKKANGDFDRRVGTAAGMDMLMEILRVVGVSKWEALPGKVIRVRAEHAKVHAIGNVLKDDWLVFEDMWKRDASKEWE